MIDLHLHTFFSDGTLSPEELVSYAKENGITTMAITDHDGVSALERGIIAGEKLGIRVMTGIEFSTEDENGIYMHLLGYGFDWRNKALNREVEMIRKKREERNNALLAALNNIGLYLSEEDLVIREGQDYVGKPTFAIALMKKGYISSPKEAFTEGKFMRSPAVRKIHREKISIQKAIKLINDAGGISVLAHPMKIAGIGRKMDFFQELDDLLVKLKNWGLDGMECYYRTHGKEEAMRLKQMADYNQLIVTAGSDFHDCYYDHSVVPGGFFVDDKFDENQMIHQIQHSIEGKKMV